MLIAGTHLGGLEKRAAILAAGIIAHQQGH
jgi:hypothetical protein